MKGETVLGAACFEMSQVNSNNRMLRRERESMLLSSLALEVDDMFFSLRKADQIIRRELKILN